MVATSHITFLDPWGEPRDLPATYGSEHAVRPSSPLLMSREVTVGSSRRLVEYRLPASSAAEPRNRECFEREVGAALRITRAVHGLPYERRFRMAAGYEMNCDEPFVLYELPAGEDLNGVGGRSISFRRADTLISELLVALRVLEGLGLVHGDIRPASVYWDGNATQLGRPAAAAFVGSPRRSGTRGPYVSPEQKRATGLADCRDDLWSVARLLYVQLTRHEPDREGEPDFTDADDLIPMAAAFLPLAEQRPPILEVLHRMNIPDPLDEASLPGDGLDTGRKAYHALLRDKHGEPTVPTPRPREPEPNGTRRRRLGRGGGAR